MMTSSLSVACRRSFAAILLAASSLTALRAIPAFPGAEGFGANALGGRGGTVVHVTNLNDSGTGSFRDAVGTANRIVVFDVGGIIRINSVVVVKNNVTIAGQTAPGGGITVYGNRVSFSDASNTICRYIRIREGINGDSGTDAVGIASGSNMIFDHVSASWGRDETFSISGSAISNITLQDCIVGQGLLVHSAGGLVQTSGGVSIFRTLYIDNWMRNPKIKGVNDYQNNVVYNWGGGGGYIPAGDSAGDTFANMIGNYFVGGFNSGVGTSPFKTGNQNYRLFHANNREDLNLDGTLNGTTVTNASFPTLQLVGTQFAYPAPLILLTPEQALQHVATYAGASLRRDSVDTGMIAELLSYGTLGKQIFNESEVGGVGTVDAAATAVIDTDNDGMPNWWEQAAGTNPAVNDASGDIDGDGYTNIENYINSLAVSGVPQLSITGILSDTGISATDAITTDGTLVIKGTAPAGATVQVSRIDTGVLGTTTADPSGNWSYDYTGVSLPQRNYGFKAALVLGGGSFSLPTPVLIVNVDNTPPAAPVITSLITSPSYTFTGTAEIFSTVNVTLNGVGVVATTTTDGVGNWSAAYSGAPLPPGAYDFTATATDLAGNIGAVSVTYSVNTALASPTFTSIADDTGLSTTDQITKDTTLTLNGTAPIASTVNITRVGTGVIGSVTASGTGAWSFVYGTTLAAGQYTFTATASSGGSSSPASAPFLVTVDTAAPTIPSINRFNPTTPATTATTIVFRVTMNEPVINVDTTDFTLTKTPSSLGGTIQSVVQVSPSVYDVTINGVSGDGTIRLDRLASANITDYAGNVTSTSFTGGQLYTIRLAGSGVWMSTDSGDLWSDSASWEDGVIASGSGVTADFSTRDIDENVVAVLDSPRTVGRLVFGDADFTTTGTWTLSNNSNAANTLTLAGGTPTIQVNALTTTGGDTVDVPAANAFPYTVDAVLAGSGGLTKTGVGTLMLTKPATISGALTITKGIVEVGTGGTLTPSSVTISTSQQLRVSGGAFNTAGNVSWTSGTGTGIIVSGGVANFQNILPSNTRNSFFRVSGGTVTVASINFPRTADSEAAATTATGILITGGNSTFGTIGLGTDNSWGNMNVSGGVTNVTGLLHVGYQKTDSRGGLLNISGGTLNTTETVLARNPTGLLTANNGSKNIAKLVLTGGVSNFGKLTLGYDNTSAGGSASVDVTTAELNLGTGGIVKNGTAALVTTLTFNSGVLGATAPWSTTHPLTLAGTPANFTIRASSDITLSGVLGGTGGFAKAGTGTLTLGAANTFTGDVAANAGTLAVTGSLAAGGSVNINDGGTLMGSGTINKPVVFNGGGTLKASIAGVGTPLSLTGALTKGSVGAHTVNVVSSTTPAINTSYTLTNFGSTDLVLSDLTLAPTSGFLGVLQLDATSLKFFVTGVGATAEYTNWVYQKGIPVAVSGPADDADGDGISNLSEFYLGLNPLAAGSDGVLATTVNVGGQQYPAIAYTRRINLGGVTGQVLVAADLNFAALLGAVEVSATPNGDGTETVVARSSVSLAVQPAQFFRIEATYPDTVSNE